MKTKIRIAILALVFVLFAQFSIAQEGTERISALQEKIKSAQSISAARQELEELVNLSFQEEKFNQLYDFLVGLEQNLATAADPYLYYCQALTRFTQMQVLNEKQMWQELFDNKDAYTQQLNAAIDKAVKLNSGVNETALRLKFIQAEMLKENENDFLSALEDLFNLAREYAQTEANPQVIKDIADELSRQKQAVYARKLYNVYVSKLAESDISQEDLLKIAQDFLDENNADLSVSLYDAYTEKLINSQQDKIEIIKQMLDVAEKFRHTGWQEGKDPFFAERLYAKIETLYTSQSFDDISQYKRAYNLERTREFGPCLKEYLKLVNDFPQYADKDRIYFRIGVINAYISGKTDEARGYFQKIVDEFPESADYLNSVYHLGLLDHWYGNFDKAKESYRLILDKTKDLTQRPEIAQMAEARLKEIEESRPVEYNLRTFLEAVLDEKKEENVPSLQLDLYVADSRSYLNENVDYRVNSYLTDTGCLQQDFTYLWSGNLGRNQNPFNNSEFGTDYEDILGTKVVNVALVDTSGIVGGTIEMADIYSKVDSSQ